MLINVYSKLIGVKHITNTDIIRRFDYDMTYRISSSIPALYFPPPEELELFTPTIPTKSKNQKVPILWFASNCNPSNNRNEYFKELHRHIPIDSAGGCFKNVKFTLNKGKGTWKQIQKYKVLYCRTL